MTYRLRRVGAAAAVVAWVLTLAGCASPAGTKEMVSDSAQVIRTHPHSVSIRTAGGRETDSMGTPQISDKALADALAESIATSQVFSKVVQGGAGDYVLSVFVVNLEQPMMGFSMTVNMEAGWSLTERQSNKVVWKDSIRSSYTAGVGEAFAAAARLRMATEGAARENIRAGIQELSKLSL